ncbi:MAG: hypothetical protein KDD10_14280 [Phaeodactylibacter sp.]|nr:hypothetical protein [Phaeodactylibacter sp.]
MTSRLPILRFSAGFALLALLLSTTAGCRAIRLRKAQALEQAEALRSGMLLVRLQSGEQRIAALKAEGMEEQAQRAAEALKAENERIAQAFSQEWDYCPVYFFFAEHSAAVRQGQFDGYLLDASLKAAPTEGLPGKTFFIAEFGTLQPSSGNAGLNALLLMDSTFQQLEDPFPSNVMTKTLGKEGMEQQAVTMLNLKIQEFLAKTRLWKKKRELREARRGL